MNYREREYTVVPIFCKKYAFFLLLLLNLVQGWRVCRDDGGWPTKFTVGALGEHGRNHEIWKTMAVRCHVRTII